MSNGYRNGAFALGLITGIGLVLNLILWSAYRANNSGKDISPKEEAKGGEQWIGYWDWLATTFFNPMDTIAQWAMAFLSLAAVYLLWETLKASRNTLAVTQDMARETTRIGEAQTRAYLSLGLGQVTIEVVENKDGCNLAVRIQTAVTNSGNTPAYSPVIHYDIQESIPSVITPLSQPESMQCHSDTQDFIPPGGTSNNQLSRVFKVDDPIAFQRFEKRFIRFSYCLNFLDEFGEDRWTPVTSGTFQHWPKGEISFLRDKMHQISEDQS